MASAVELESVSKLYGTFVALRKVSLCLPPSRCCVLLGDNGAGKSTLLRLIAGLIRPTHGTVRIFGEAPHGARERIGYMSHSPMLYEEFSGAENLHYFAALYRERECMSPEAALAAVGLDASLTRPVGQYSQGMRQRASLARVLLARSELLLLDEPFSNMDAASARQMLELLAGLRAEGKTIVLTTHQRELAEPLADILLTLQGGSVASLIERSAEVRR